MDVEVDIPEMMDIIQDLESMHAIGFKIPDYTCPHCGHRNTDLKIPSIEELLFTKLQKGM